MTMGRTIRIAANTIDTGSHVVEPGVVKMDNGLVVAVEPLTEECEATVWLGGTITLKRNAEGHGIEAFHNGKRL